MDVELEGCAQLYAPTFDNVFSRTLMPTCAPGGGACHESPEAAGAEAGGLAFVDVQQAHGLLLDTGTVVASDAACSPLIVRLEVDDPDLRMPPGAGALDERERCSMATWIAEGAAR